MFTILFCIGIIVGMHCARLKQPASINKDSTEITQLLEKIWSRKPDPLNRAEPLIYCAVMDKCCEDKDRVEAISLMNQYSINSDGDRFLQIMQGCMNSSNSKKEDHVCSSVVKSKFSTEAIFNDNNVRIYMDIINHRVTGLNQFVDEISSTCNNKELHAFICLSNNKLMQKCIVKVLQKTYDGDYKNYQTNIEGLKEMMISANEQISEELSIDRNHD
jgi:hypothetical protein